MLQRSPTYMMSESSHRPDGAVHSEDVAAQGLPTPWCDSVNSMIHYVSYFGLRKAPKLGRWMIRKAEHRCAAARAMTSTCTSSPATTRGINACAWCSTATSSSTSAQGACRGGDRSRRSRRPQRHRVEVGRPRRRRRHRDGHGIAVAGARWHPDSGRRRRGQADRPLRLQGVPHRGRSRTWRGASATPTRPGRCAPT